MSLQNILQTYSLSEIIELNDLTEEEVLEFLINSKVLELPDPAPLDYD